MTSANNDVASQQYVSSSLSSSRKRVGLEVGVCRKCGGQGHNGENARVLKKGPWTAEEDALLIDYVKKHGERHWNCVQKTGLMRCGKSCRLRWTNHLRPDLKKGSFSIEEERIVLDLQAKLGNKWSKIAAQLPGRTDNEVKNFWNTKIKRRMKANLLSINYDGSSIQRPHTFRQIQATRNQIHGFRQEICSISDSINTSNNHGFSFNIPNYIPMSIEQNDLRKTNPNIINLTKINDPILSFLNNPAYNKFQLVNEATNFNVNNSPLPFSPIPIQNLSTNSGNLTMYDFPNNSQHNSISLDATSLLASSTCDKVEVPIHNPHLHITPTSDILSDSYDLNDIWITSTSLGKSIEMEKSTITQEGQCDINNFVDDDGGHMLTVLRGQGTSHMEEPDEQSRVLSQNEAFKLKKEELDKLVCLDDDLSGLLYNFSNNGSPPPSYHHSSDFLSEFIHYKEHSDVSFSLTSLPPALSFQEFDCNFNNNYCNHAKTH